MDERILDILEENNELLQEHIKIAKDNAKKIKKIQSYMRRTFVARVSYWIIIILVTAGALYAVRPYVKKATSSYNAIQEKLDTSKNILDPSHLFKDVGVLNQVFEFFSNKEYTNQTTK